VAIVLRSGLYNTCVTVLLFVLSWKMTLFMLAILTPALVAGPLYGKFRRRIAKEISDGQAACSNVAEESLANIRTVKAFATEERECVDYWDKCLYVYDRAKLAALYYGAFQFMMNFIQFGSMTVLVWFAAFLNSSGDITVGEFTSF